MYTLMLQNFHRLLKLQINLRDLTDSECEGFLLLYHPRKEQGRQISSNENSFKMKDKTKDS